jgi:hypothetical protein
MATVAARPSSREGKSTGMAPPASSPLPHTGSAAGIAPLAALLSLHMHTRSSAGMTRPPRLSLERIDSAPAPRRPLSGNSSKVVPEPPAPISAAAAAHARPAHLNPLPEGAQMKQAQQAPWDQQEHQQAWAEAKAAGQATQSKDGPGPVAESQDLPLLDPSDNVSGTAEPQQHNPLGLQPSAIYAAYAADVGEGAARSSLSSLSEDDAVVREDEALVRKELEDRLGPVFEDCRRGSWLTTTFFLVLVLNVGAVWSSVIFFHDFKLILLGHLTEHPAPRLLNPAADAENKKTLVVLVLGVGCV